jgi:hypothetical protein
VIYELHLECANLLLLSTCRYEDILDHNSDISTSSSEPSSQDPAETKTHQAYITANKAYNHVLSMQAAFEAAISKIGPLEYVIQVGFNPEFIRHQGLVIEEIYLSLNCSSFPLNEEFIETIQHIFSPFPGAIYTRESMCRITTDRLTNRFMDASLDISGGEGTSGHGHGGRHGKGKSKDLPRGGDGNDNPDDGGGGGGGGDDNPDNGDGGGGGENPDDGDDGDDSGDDPGNPGGNNSQHESDFDVRLRSMLEITNNDGEVTHVINSKMDATITVCSLIMEII